MQIITPSLDRLGGPELEAIRIAKQRVCPDQQVQVNTPASADPTDYITVGVLGQPGCTATCVEVTPDTVEDAMRRALWRDERPRLWIDLETKSGTDVKHGAYRYAEDPEFEILMASYAVDDGPVARVEGHDNVVRVLGPAVRSSDVLKVAHNALFDRIALSRALLEPQEYLDPADWDDTAAHMVSHGWPASLKQGAEALGAEPKDEAGTRLINLFSLPPYADPAEHPKEWADFGAYCDQDVATMRDMAHRFIARYGREWWTNEEREVWVQEQRINDRGVALDLELARCGDAADAIVKRKAAERITEITGIANPNSGPQWRQYLIEQHADEEFPDLDKRRITKAVEAGALDDRPVLKEALLLKLVATSKSASKFAAALDGVCEDGRYRGSFKYHGAHTGRWSGKGLQLHNLSHDTFAKDFGENLRITLEKVAACKAGEPLSGKELGMLIRPMMVGPFSIADFTGIEALVTGWLAGEQWVVDSYQDIKDFGDAADDIYVATGKKIGGNLSRSEAKVMVLASGFSGGVGAYRRMGAESIIPYDEMRAAFDKMLEEGGHELPANGDLPAQPLHEMHWPILKAAWGDAYIQQLINSWRASNPRIVAFWDRLHAALKHGGTAGAHIWVTKRDDERIVHLPSGRCLAYQRVGLGVYRVNTGTTKEPVMEQRAGLHRFDWRNKPVTMWRGLVIENVVQATARDFLAWSLPRLAEANLPVVSHVHDEILVEDPEGSQTDRLAELMAADVPWAQGLPLSAGAYTCPVYVKD